MPRPACDLFLRLGLDCTASHPLCILRFGLSNQASAVACVSDLELRHHYPLPHSRRVDFAVNLPEMRRSLRAVSPAAGLVPSCPDEAAAVEMPLGSSLAILFSKSGKKSFLLWFQLRSGLRQLHFDLLVCLYIQEVLQEFHGKRRGSFVFL